jgi:cytochrome c553
MKIPLRQADPKVLVAWAFIAAAVLGVTALLAAVSGAYSVAASAGHWAITREFLEFGMDRSVWTNSLGVKTVDIDDPDMVQLGAAHYQAECAMCHGAPGEPANPVTRGMLPPPPPLTGSSYEWLDRELFWIVKHGLKYTGMPAWATQQRDDEVWTVVAFLHVLPHLDAAGYRALAFGPAADMDEPPLAPGPPQVLTLCIRCHGDGANPPPSRLVPTLAGQSPDYMFRALGDYAKGDRPSGIMQPIAVRLSAREGRALAQYYAALAPDPAGGEAADPERLRLGEAIARFGLPGEGIPACLTCHGETRRSTYPRLHGQRADFIETRLNLWRDGGGLRVGQGAIMAPIAARLDERQAQAVAAYFSQLEGPAPSEAEP